MRVSRGAAVGVALLAFFHSGHTRAQEPEALLNYGIVGSESGAYSSVISRVAIQKLLLDLAAGPRSAAYVDAALAGSGAFREDLEKLELIRRRGADYVINFTLYTRSDVRQLREVSERYGRSLAAALLERRPEIEAALRPYAASGQDAKAVAFVVMGCFSLDWDGLEVTAEKGYRSVAKLRPDGDQYIPWAEEKNELTLKGIYWGSHNEYQAEVVFTSFGDHFSLLRYALPDLFWRIPGRASQAQMPDSLKPKLQRAVGLALQGLAGQAARMLFALREDAKSLEALGTAAGMKPEEAADLLALLVELDYVGEEAGNYRRRVPVLTAGDLPMVRELRRIGREVMESWLAANYACVKEDLGEITPLRYGVSYADGFTQIWHYLFGTANRHLVEAGLFADPYAAERKFKGFVPVVWHPSLAEEHTTPGPH